MNGPDVNSAVNAVIDRLRAVADPIAVLAGESYGEAIDEAVKALYELRARIEDDYAERDKRIKELEADAVWHLRERDEAVAILGRKTKALEDTLRRYEHEAKKKREAQAIETQALDLDQQGGNVKWT